ncbi:cryptochrome DASH [Candidatus Phycosocius bacilliformis]|uniref:Cryptochrome DASH n=1 Tax=Candidatus Phycosocius bacilliformis TaxID=1445552 RepID=A0A2P2E5P3_9PROT|nr:FAD-binding domain-containing protein [Candidatus Phycosocius bacilliformis]GBF56382.1 cryptochrome DASH [Candidatus Phycosocius bacilliformis]
MSLVQYNHSLQPLSHVDWTPTRAAGLARLEAFLPQAGPAYARTRNTDLGPQDRSNVSALSPWLARRILTEEEVGRRVLQVHGFVKAEKFIQEVYWRSYWKGWLELRPQVLTRFNSDRLALKRLEADDADLAHRLAQARAGQTGIACFDAWVEELTTLGWLHNHARMWFASIWIFTLQLPWQLGADFFFKHLMDADVASNTLSWRWVAGLHTKGKHYVARASNIEAHTQGRFNPVGQLNETALPLAEPFLETGPGQLPLAEMCLERRVGLLLTADDLHPHSINIPAKVVGAAVLGSAIIGPNDGPKNCFLRRAEQDACARMQADFDVDTQVRASVEDLVAWATSLNVREIVTPYAPVGPTGWQLADVQAALTSHGIRLVRLRRAWDSKTWPLATGGFFKLKEKLPKLVAEQAGR